MSLATVQFFSDGLHRRSQYDVLLPESGDGPFPVLLQLHGLTDDSHSWVQQSNIARYAARYPMIVVMPDGGTSGYVNLPVPLGADGEESRIGRANYEDMIIRDLREHVARTFNVRPGPWAIGGLSMGGYGAMRLGLKYPELFNSIWAHSSAVLIGTMVADRVAEADDALWITHARRLSDRHDRPVISFDCGLDDTQLLGDNRTFDRQLTELGISHHYAEHPGGHTWDYWDEHVREALAQHARVFGINRTP